jgi:hypothetical protein
MNETIHLTPHLLFTLPIGFGLWNRFQSGTVREEKAQIQAFFFAPVAFALIFSSSFRALF